jgi:hypothetical protein
MAAYNTAASSEMLTFLKRQLIHAIIHLLLTPEFIHAYQHGIEVLCADGLWRLIFPRFFAYSADYPEKYVRAPPFISLSMYRMLIAALRSKGKCLCPHCFIKAPQVSDLGTKVDMKRRTNNIREDTDRRWNLVELARKLIFQLGRVVNGSSVDGLLKPGSWVPVQVSLENLI